MIALLTLAGWHVTGVIMLATGLALLILGTPDWKPGERLHFGDAGDMTAIVYGLFLTFVGAAAVSAS